MDTQTRALLNRIRAFAMPGGAPEPRRVTTTETGEIRSGPSASWIRLTATQWLDPRGLQFRWEARARMAPLVTAAVVDAYENGRGELTVRVLGRVKVASLSGPEADRGELIRLLASFTTCPMAFDDHPALDWSAVSPVLLRSRCRMGSADVTVDFTVGEDGRVLGSSAPDRPRQVGKAFVPTPWSTSCDEYRTFGALRVPVRIDASWHTPEGSFVYYRGTISDLTVD